MAEGQAILALAYACAPARTRRCGVNPPFYLSTRQKIAARRDSRDGPLVLHDISDGYATFGNPASAVFSAASS